MKIQNINTVQVEQLSRSEVGATAPESTEVLFSRSLSNEAEAAYVTRINQLIGDIGKQGELLAKRADMGELQKYRSMITELINETVSNGFAFKKSGGFNSRGKTKVFATIKRINEKLDEMTQKLLHDEKKNINMLDDVDDIRGLLVDMYL